MRKELEEIEKIDRFLNGELSEIEAEAFQKEIDLNLTLKKEVEKQQLLQEGIQSLMLKLQAQKAFTKFKTFKILKYIGIPSSIIATSLVIWNLTQTEISVPETPIKMDTTITEPRNLIDSLPSQDTLKKDKINPIHPEAALSIPDIIIEAEDYINFYDITPQNLGNQYREDAVDIYLSDSNFVVGHTFPKEWLEYNFDIPASGEYEILFTIASGQDSVQRKMNLSINGAFKELISVPFTSSWLTYQTISIGKHQFKQGSSQNLRLDFETGWINLDKITLVFKQE